ncbi:MAG: hypothetical protein LUB58_05055 [Oscillospiraceae bacterium]|nr:hypothetical protein [Oscillospiraceae bacterium]
MNQMSFLKGMGAGLIVGARIGMAVKPEKPGCKCFRRALHTMGKIIEDVGDTIRF